MGIKKAIANVPKTPLSISNPIDTANLALNNLVDAWKECSIVAEQEQTKRDNIRAYREINIKAIEENSAILKLYLEKTFAERALVIQEIFDRLDKGLESGNSEITSLAIAAIVDVTKQSPLAEMHELITNYHNPKVTKIEI